MFAVDIDVVIGIIYAPKRKKVLLSQRRDTQQYAGLWEFPGGKCNAGEDPFHALQRELHEELGITVDAARPLIKIRQQQRGQNRLLDVWEIERWQGTACGREGQKIHWATVEQLSTYRFPEANQPMITAIQLPSLYLISPDLLTCNFDPIDRLRHFLKRGLRLFQLRCIDTKSAAYATLVSELNALCKQYRATLMLNIEPQYLKQHKVKGLHLSSSRLMQLDQRPFDHTYQLSASCHSATELRHAAALGIDFVTLSPVAATKSHPEAAPLGWDAFKQLAASVNVPVYALGGMSTAQLTTAWQAGAQGLAIISALWDAAQDEGQQHYDHPLFTL